MIVVDTSALIAIVQNEPAAERCRMLLRDETRVVISAATLAEALIVAARRGFGGELQALVRDLGFHVEPVTEETAYAVNDAYSRWGKGVHSARLNFADCFAYVVARDHGCALLYVGDDFARTDVASAL